MILPTDYSWLEPVLLAAVVVFFVDLIGNFISFSNRFLNALTTALVFAIVFGGLTFLASDDRMGSISKAPGAVPEGPAPAPQ
jgi:uncharacterized membrane protein